MDNAAIPAGFPGNNISPEEAAKMLGNGLREVYTKQLMAACAPIMWWSLDQPDHPTAHSGTVTFLKTEERVLGVTAWHVFDRYHVDSNSGDFALQIFNAREDRILDRVIDQDHRLDIAVFDVDEDLLKRIGKKIVPTAFPTNPPDEGSGILLAGFPGKSTRTGKMSADFGLFTVLGVARTVTPTQITWLFEPKLDVLPHEAEKLPESFDLGGISGGPLIAWFGSEAGVLSSALCGIVIEATRLNNPEAYFEKVVATRTDVITKQGTIARRV